jgi:hypothetical protein
MVCEMARYSEVRVGILLTGHAEFLFREHPELNTAVVPDAPHADAVLTFAREMYSTQLMAELQPLLDAHHEEVPQLGLPIDPDFTLYKSMADKNMLRIFTARIEGLLVGYQVFGVMKHPHRKYSFEAIQQLLYLDPECRKGWTAIRFLRYCWQALEDEGVRVIHQQIDAHHPFGKIFERYGFVLTDLTYARCA